MSAEEKIHLEIVHVLFVDLVGYSKLLIDDQREVLGQMNELIRGTPHFREADAAGKVIPLPSGDGMALCFLSNPEDPVECALEISEALPNYPRIQLRMGVHSGPVSGVTDVNERSIVAGAGINMAQRVMDIGDAGHILLSKRAAGDLLQYRHWESCLHELGEFEVKHGVMLSVVNLYTDKLGNPQVPEKLKRLFRKQAATRRRKRMLLVGLLLLTIALSTGVLILLRRTPPSPPASVSVAIPEKSIAVLPFENLVEDKANSYLVEGIQDEILTRLSKIADLKVISRTSTRHYQSAPENLPEIARQLSVAHILEGSVQKSGDAVRVNVKLIKAANDSHLWSETLDRKLTDIFSLESEVAKTIADQLRVKLTGQEEQAIAAKPTDNPEAYDAYLRGMSFKLQPQTTPANSLGAQKYLKEAVRLDPKFALAWAELSYVDSVGYSTSNLQPTLALREEARQAAETALALQSNLGEAVHAKGYYFYACIKDYDTAALHYERARQLMPNASQIPDSLAILERKRGHWDRSESYFNEAERLDPRNVDLLNQHALSYIYARRFPEALRKIDEILKIIPDDMATLVLKAAVAQAEGDLPRAAALLAPLNPPTIHHRALETKIYQAILERRPASVIPRLKEILAQPDPVLGYINGELLFWLGWAQEVGGDPAGAQESWRQARSELESFLKEQPENVILLGDLALTNMGLGDKPAALALAERAMAAMPIEKDVLYGSVPIEILARIAARMGEPDRAIAALEKLFSIPCFGALADGVPLTPALLRLDPMFDPLRKDPRFQKLVSTPARK